MSGERKKAKAPPPAQLQAAKEEEEEEIADGYNWKGIGISLLVISGICSVIALAILLLTPRHKNDDSDVQKISLMDVVQNTLMPRRFNGSWISDNQLEFRDKDRNLVIYTLRGKGPKLLLENTTFDDYNVEKYSISADHNYVLLLHDVKKLYRYSYKAKYKIYDVMRKKISSLHPPDDPDAFLQYAKWGPRDNQLVYVYGNNLYYIPEVNGTHYPLSTSGVDKVIFNGIPDWLYEEELLKDNGAVWWSPDGYLLCYATFNDSKVGNYHYTGYVYQNDSLNPYPQLLNLRYPKPGLDNPSAFLWVIDLRTPQNVLQRDVKPPREVQDQLVNVWFVITGNSASYSRQRPLFICCVLFSFACGWFIFSSLYFNARFEFCIFC